MLYLLLTEHITRLARVATPSASCWNLTFTRARNKKSLKKIKRWSKHFPKIGNCEHSDPTCRRPNRPTTSHWFCVVPSSATLFFVFVFDEQWLWWWWSSSSCSSTKGNTKSNQDRTANTKKLFTRKKIIHAKAQIHLISLPCAHCLYFQNTVSTGLFMLSKRAVWNLGHFMPWRGEKQNQTLGPFWYAYNRGGWIYRKTRFLFTRGPHQNSHAR